MSNQCRLSRFVRLNLEVLEDRTTPSTLDVFDPLPPPLSL